MDFRKTNTLYINKRNLKQKCNILNIKKIIYKNLYQSM